MDDAAVLEAALTPEETPEAAEDLEALVAQKRAEAPGVAPQPVGNVLVIGKGLEVRMLPPLSLREQEVNAQIMKPRDFAQLVENIKKRGQLESMPYCCQLNPTDPVEIISGHHRVRAAIVAELPLIPVIVDTLEMTRSNIVSKQLAHNALHGESDIETLRRMVDSIDNPDDLLSTGLDVEHLPTPDAGTDFIGPPTVDFEWRTLAFTFVPQQFQRFEDLIRELDGRQDLVGVADVECFQDFAAAVAKYSRIRDIRSMGTVIARLTQAAWAEVADIDEDAGDETWVPLSKIVGTTNVPPEVAVILQSLIERMLESGDITERAKWRALELAAADMLAGL